MLKAKGIDTILRYTEEGRIYGATFHRPPHGMRVERLSHGQGTSANALQEHFTLPYAGQPPIPLSIPLETGEEQHGQTAPDYENTVGGVGLLSPEGPAVDAEEEAFIRAMQRKRKNEETQGLGNVNKVSTNNQKFSIYVTRRRFEGTGENHGFPACREYYFSGHERVLVLLRSHTAVGCGHRRGGQILMNFDRMAGLFRTIL